jgi:3-isopropylmalate/(R)-2-methylmalate dehydratase small subunit
MKGEGRDSGTVIRGRAWIFGDHVDTDAIIPARHCGTFLREELAPHAMTGIDPSFAGKVRIGDIIVAGANFGSGSSRENAPLALLGAGVAAVIAVSFGRIFFRNCINVGLPIFECEGLVEITDEGHTVWADPRSGRLGNEALGREFSCPAYPAAIREIIESGGMVPYVRKRLARSAQPSR